MPSVEGVKISQLPQANTLDESDVLAGVQTGTTKKFALSTLVAWIKAHLNLTAADVGAVSTSDVGAAGGVAGLDNNGKVPGTQLDLSGKQDTITASGILKGDGQGGVAAAIAGTDYATPAQLADKANQSQLAYVETGTTASRAYAVGEFFCLNGLLYRVTSAISSGDLFNPGSNCEQVTVGGEITATVNQWTPTNGSSVSNRCAYAITGGSLIIFFGLQLSSALANHTEVEVMTVSTAVGRSVVSATPICSTTGMAYLQNQNDVFVRLQYNNGKVYIRNDSGASLGTNRIIYGQLILPIV